MAYDEESFLQGLAAGMALRGVSAIVDVRGSVYLRIWEPEVLFLTLEKVE